MLNKLKASFKQNKNWAYPFSVPSLDISINRPTNYHHALCKRSSGSIEADIIFLRLASSKREFPLNGLRAFFPDYYTARYLCEQVKIARWNKISRHLAICVVAIENGRLTRPPAELIRVQYKSIFLHVGCRNWMKYLPLRLHVSNKESNSLKTSVPTVY